MDEEMKNMSALKEFMESNPTVNHLSKALSVFYADVFYHDDVYEDIILKQTEIRFQHSYNNEVTITALRPPYYCSFWFTHQHFELKDGMLFISGNHHDDPSKRYIVQISKA